MAIRQIISQTFERIKAIRLSNNIISYLICVAIASIVWLLSTLNKDYTTELTYPVKYINLPEDKYPLSELPAQLRLEVQAKGFVLLSYRLKTSFLPITINFNTYSKHLKDNKDIFEYTLYTDDIKDKMSSQIDSDIKLLNIYPESIEFQFATAKQKKVAIRPNIDYTLKQQYILTQMTAIPDSISVSGPALIIDTLQYIATEPLHLKKLSKNTSRTLNLASSPNLYFKAETVEVLLEIEQFTEMKRTLPITILNIPDSMNIRLFPPQINISYDIGLSKYDQVSDQDFVFSVDYPKNSKTDFLEVKITQSPDFVKNISYSPKQVEYILEKK